MIQATQSGRAAGLWCVLRGLCLIGILLTVANASKTFAQVDQGTITGVVQDSAGAVIPGADITLTNTDSGLIMHAKAGASGVFVFSPIKIGHYTLGASAPRFQTTLQQDLKLDLDQNLNIAVTLKPGNVSETVTVTSAPPLLQDQEASVNQVMNTQTINNTPLAERNWVYMAQLDTGVVPSYGTRGGGHGDYSANGQRASQNNYLLDGVDNNVNIVDNMNGSLYAVSPPPDAISEFKLDTAAYSAQYGHSAGSVLNVALKSGTNQIHGDVWEYNRNTFFNAENWNANPLLKIPPYHFNQFGATLGLPIFKNKLFYFGDLQITRIALGSINGPISTPTPRMRQGDFSELLTAQNTSGGSCPIILYQPNSNNGHYSCSNKMPTTLNGSLQQYGTQATVANGYTYAPGQNVFNPAVLNPVAQNILKMYPLPNYGGWNSTNNSNTSTAHGQTFNNLLEVLPTWNDIVQWDQRLDWDISARDRAYARYSYSYMYNKLTPPLGLVLDGTGNFAGSRQHYMSQNFMFSETHLFNPNLINELRLGYNWGNYQNIQPNSDVNLAATLGMGGMPFGPGYFKNGGLPAVSISGIQAFGSHGNDPSVELQNIYQLLDNVTKIWGNHTIKFGFSTQNFRIFFLQPPNPRGSYNYSGTYTAVTSVGNTGSGVADFLTNQMNGNSLTNEPIDNLQNWYNSAYAEDTWKILPKLTLSFGVRYDYFQPTGEMAGGFANFVPVTRGIGTGTANYVLPAKWKGTSNLFASEFTDLLTTNNVTVVYDSNPRLSTGQKTNFGPRVGLALHVDPRTVVRAGAGVFYGAIFGLGSNPNIGGNYPFMIHSGLSATSCVNGNATNQSGITTYCPSLSPTTAASAVGAGQHGAAQNYPTTGQFQDPGDTLEIGMTNQISGPDGIKGFINSTVINGRDEQIKTPYTFNYNLSVQHAFGNNLSATLMYVGNVARHLPTLLSTNQPSELQASGKNSSLVEPFPSLGNNPLTHYAAESSYNSLQAKLEKRFSSGMSYLASYTWAHNLDNSIDPLGGGTGYRMWNIIPIKDEITNSNYDVRQRFTFNGSYELPFGRGRALMNTAPSWLDEIAGGWRSDLTFIAQSGIPFTVGTSTINTPSGQQSTHAILAGDPFAPGGTPNPTNPQTTCAAATHTRTHWFNPCAFNNPLNGASTANTNNGVGQFPSTPITDEATAIMYLGGKSNAVYGPGYERINMGLSKQFTTFREQYVQFRADAFNLFNHPSWANPSNTGITGTGGLITSPLNLQSNVPDARFFQLSAKYVF
jgi:Carboxypeptidase regulatory-like domain/TonB-dependent Receptor Plug Domain